MSSERIAILVVGGGIAGLSTAFHLAKRGRTDVMVVDRENQAGFYSSSHNAAIARQLTGRDEHTVLTKEGCLELRKAGLLDGRGGILLAADPGGLDAFVQEAARFEMVVERLSGSPYADLKAAEHLRIASDGVIDIDGMLRHCTDGLRAAGGHTRFGCAVQSIQPSSTGFKVDTDQGVIHAEILVNASGGWARELGRMAGGLDIAFKPLRRHLVWSDAPFPQDRPWTWWADRPFYMRPESGGLLLCPLDEEEIPLPPRYQQPPTNDSVLESLAASLRELSPELVERPITRLWSGLRTFAPDRGFVIGRDPVNPRLFWVAGLGGHGMTSGLAVGDLAARAIVEHAETGLLDPKRFMARKAR